ncbi:hypothetical protein ASG87_06160 [Frateuria sp. Soil773]|uniref:hypothetical protein n=1 Tax=Frateuria sp. Soil773 TaxID=1736407 RepID=UPI0006F68EDC|nr:hypothetical protein [Frateuria sp. Soil773]KRE89119.1 hypothetical protein ASG87_06160 [Frateuria sp. Soil773]
MKTFLKLAFALACAASLQACVVTTRAYVDPQHRPASQAALLRPAQPIPVKVRAEFRTNGVPTAKATPVLQHEVEQALLAGGVFVPAVDAGATLDVTANDTTDLKDAHAKGVHYGLTLGSSGIAVDDDYEFTIVYRSGAGGDHRSIYRHAIHSTIGDISGPAGAQPTTTAQAFRSVVEDVVLDFTRDAQAAGLTAP